MTRKLYLAARFSQRAELETIAHRLVVLGFEITARWVFGNEDGLDREQIAFLDLADVDACDTIVSFSLPVGTMTKGGGRHVEFGYALARRKRMVLIGPRENVFHHHPDVEVFAALDDWLHALNLTNVD